MSVHDSHLRVMPTTVTTLTLSKCNVSNTNTNHHPDIRKKAGNVSREPEVVKTPGSTSPTGWHAFDGLRRENAQLEAPTHGFHTGRSVTWLYDTVAANLLLAEQGLIKLKTWLDGGAGQFSQPAARRRRRVKPTSSATCQFVEKNQISKQPVDELDGVHNRPLSVRERLASVMDSGRDKLDPLDKAALSVPSESSAKMAPKHELAVRRRAGEGTKGSADQSMRGKMWARTCCGLSVPELLWAFFNTHILGKLFLKKMRKATFI